MTHNHLQHKHDLGYEIKEPIVHTIIVAIHNQSLHALDKDNKTIFSYNCATGSNRHETPLGKYIIDKHNNSLKQASEYKSREFSDARMPYPMFIDNSRGIAIHGSGLTTNSGFNTHIIPIQSYAKRILSNSVGGLLGSHGCIRLPLDDALELYLHTPQGAHVVVRKFWIVDDK